MDTYAQTSTSSKRFEFNIEGLKQYGTRAPSHAFSRRPKDNKEQESEGLKSLGKSLKSNVTMEIFPEDLSVSDRKLFDPQDRCLLFWNKIFVMSCILAVSIDPLFFYLPMVEPHYGCLGMDFKLAVSTTTLRTVVDAFYLIHMAFNFRTAYIAPSSRVFGRGELVIDTKKIAIRYLRCYFIIDFLSVLPLPQIVVLKYLVKAHGRGIMNTKNYLKHVVFIQYIFRFGRFYHLTSDLKKTAGVFAESVWLGVLYYLLWYMLSSHIVGALWYLFAVERIDACWTFACHTESEICNVDLLYCKNHNALSDVWKNISQTVIGTKCSLNIEISSFNFGIYSNAISSQIVEAERFRDKFYYCLWWGLQNLSTLGQGLQTSTYPGEVIFSIAVAIAGLILFALLIGNMQTYLQSMTIRLEEMRIKRRDSERWMHHRMLPKELRERVRHYNQYKWLETRGVDEESLVRSLPKDLRRDIKRHLCLNLVRRVRLFANMDERLLDAICERLKPSLYIDNTYIVREGDPVDEMLFVIRGKLESVTTDGGRSGFYNRGLLKEGDFCGEELLTWALDPKAGTNFPLSTRSVKALTEVEAFALRAEELKFVAGQFRRLHSKQVQHTFRFYSHQWRTWAACFIQTAWRRKMKRKYAEALCHEEEEGIDYYYDDDDEDDIYEDHGEQERLIKSHHTNKKNKNKKRLTTTIYASKFARNALRKIRGASTSIGILQKPPEPDFSNLN